MKRLAFALVVFGACLIVFGIALGLSWKDPTRLALCSMLLSMLFGFVLSSAGIWLHMYIVIEERGKMVMPGNRKYAEGSPSQIDAVAYALQAGACPKCGFTTAVGCRCTLLEIRDRLSRHDGRELLDMTERIPRKEKP